MPPKRVQNSRNLIVNYLPRFVDENMLIEIFQEHGPIEQVKIVREKDTGKSKTYGFVTYVDVESAAEAMRKKNGFVIGNKTLKVGIARLPTDSIESRKLVIKGLPLFYTQKDALDFFSQWGEVIECRLLTHPVSGESLGQCFVSYVTSDDCLQAFLSLPAIMLEGTTKVSVELFNKDHFTDRHQQKREMGRPLMQVDHDYGFASHHPSAQGQRQFAYIEQGQYPPYQPARQSQYRQYYEPSHTVYPITHETLSQSQNYPPYEQNPRNYETHSSKQLSPYASQYSPPSRDMSAMRPHLVPEDTFGIPRHSHRSSSAEFDMNHTRASGDLAAILAKSVIVITNLPPNNYINDICIALCQYGMVTDIYDGDSTPKKVEVVVWQTETKMLRQLSAMENQVLMLPGGRFVDVESVTSEIVE